MEDVEAVASACGLQLDAHLAVEDRSWWSQIALQLELDPLDRVRRLTPAGSPDLAAALGGVADVAENVIIIGEVAGALRGWPLILGGDVMEACAQPATAAPLLAAIARRHDDGEYELPDGARLRLVEMPPGTHGFADLSRGAEPVELKDGQIRVASVVDLMRIADASTHRGARLEALAYQAVLDVHHARSKTLPADRRTPSEKIDAWLRQQTPVPT